MVDGALRSTGVRAILAFTEAVLLRKSPLQKERGHELVEANKTTIPVPELLKIIPDFDGLIVRR